MFQSPSLRGSGRFKTLASARAAASFRVSIPFIAGQWSLPDPALSGVKLALACFNPLHCGAVVASKSALRRKSRRGRRVSIPFIAGQWSLHITRRCLCHHNIGFNPLHCGAVVASNRAQAEKLREELVSIPFIAGQWSLLIVASAALLVAATFQSPSLRGSGRFGRHFQAWTRSGPGFNPLHCGAVVASRDTLWAAIALPSFNPLHCGAVVASRRRPPRTGGRQGFNPLHCGAVVASW